MIISKKQFNAEMTALANEIFFGHPEGRREPEKEAPKFKEVLGIPEEHPPKENKK